MLIVAPVIFFRPLPEGEGEKPVRSFVNPTLKSDIPREAQERLVAASASEWNADPNAVHSLALAATN